FDKHVAGTKEKADARAPEIEWSRVQFVFDKDGRLAERQLVHMPKGEVAGRQVIDQDGTVTFLDAKGKEIAIRKGSLRAERSAGPELQPSTKNLVVLSLPFRTPEHVQRTLKLEKKRLEDLRLAEALPLFAAYVGAGNGGEALNVFRRCFHNREQRQ